MTTASESDVLELEMRVKASAETVFGFLSDGPGMARWFGRSVEMDATPGGTIRVDINGNDIAQGEIVEIVPNERVVFTFGWEGEGHPVPPGASTVEISLAEDGDETIVRLKHTGLNADQAGGHKEGWEHYLPRLVELAAGGDPGVDPWSKGEM